MKHGNRNVFGNPDGTGITQLPERAEIYCVVNRIMRPINIG